MSELSIFLVNKQTTDDLNVADSTFFNQLNFYTSKMDSAIYCTALFFRSSEHIIPLHID